MGPSPFSGETFTVTLCFQSYLLPTVLQMYRQERFRLLLLPTVLQMDRQERLHGVLFAARGAEQLMRRKVGGEMARRKGGGREEEEEQKVGKNG